MLSTVMFHQLRHHFLSVRFHLAFLMTFLLFGMGTISFIRNYRLTLNEYERHQSELRHASEETAKQNLTRLAVQKRDYILKPREDAFIADSKEKYIPTCITYNAFNVFGFSTQSENRNPYRNPFEELNWRFIVSIVLSFAVLLFTHDAISGEKEAHTLAISLSNSVSRGTFLLGGYFATILTSLFIVVPGICFSLAVILSSGTAALSFSALLEISGFLFASIIFLSCVAAFGLLASVLAKNSGISLLFALIMWVLFVVVVPNSAIFLSHTFFPIENSETVNAKVQSALDLLEKNGRKERLSMNGIDLFYPPHQIRAEHQMNRMNAEMNIRNDRYRNMFCQFERARMLTFISPVSLYEYLCEAAVGGGYLRFQHAWKELHAYQLQFLVWFKSKDALDAGSPHWYNPYEDLSTTRKPVNFGEIPVFTEGAVPFTSRILSGSVYLAVLLIIAITTFFSGFVLFVRYDVR